MAEGQFLGPRAAYLYVSDSGEQFVVRLDATLGDLPGIGLVRATTGNAGGATGKPVGMELRGVHWQGELNGRVVRKFLVCAATGAYYEGNVSQSVTIDGVAGVTTGKRGERQSFIKLDNPSDP